METEGERVAGREGKAKVAYGFNEGGGGGGWRAEEDVLGIWIGIKVGRECGEGVVGAEKRVEGEEKRVVDEEKRLDGK